MSVFSLGTAQLGMSYGVNNKDGQPTESVAMQILEKAAELGVNSFDTSNNYGDSEGIIGKWLRTKDRDGPPVIITKIGPLDHSSRGALHADVRRQIDASKQNLGIETFDILMLHDFADYEKDPVCIRQIFQELKDSGEIRLSAVSAYSQYDYGMISRSGFDAVQIPLNIFDWSQINNGGIQKLIHAGMMIFVRSVFLQGLIFKTPKSIDPRMGFCGPCLAKFYELCKKFQLPPAVLALSFPLSIPGITAIVLGCDNPAQVEENCRLIDRTVQLSESQMEQLCIAFKDTDPRVTDPRCWFNAMK